MISHHLAKSREIAINSEFNAFSDSPKTVDKSVVLVLTSSNCSLLNAEVESTLYNSASNDSQIFLILSRISDP
ncbi:Uncharacterised protein [Chlamydia trachomatis]|nr:Uncharacterised protein [Chlamydia trachomatis]